MESQHNREVLRALRGIDSSLKKIVEILRADHKIDELEYMQNHGQKDTAIFDEK